MTHNYDIELKKKKHLLSNKTIKSIYFGGGTPSAIHHDFIFDILNTIKENKLATDDQIKNMQSDVKQIVDESIAFAEDSPELEPHELYEDVYVEKDYPFIKD